MKRNQDEILLKEGFVAAKRVADATGAVLSTVHRQIASTKIPGRKVGSGWYVDVHKYAELFEPEGAGATIRAALDELRRDVPRPKPNAEPRLAPQRPKPLPGRGRGRPKKVRASA